jgi:long-chain acyl-CoA synthetase
MANFYTRFLQAVQQFPAHVAFQMQRENGDLETYTFSDTRKMADSVAVWLESSGINRGARCAILASNSPRWVTVYFGILASGRIAVPFDTAFNADQVAKLLKDSGAELLVTDSVHVAVAKSALEKSPCRLVLLDKSKDAPELASLDSVLSNPRPDPFPVAEVGSGETACILYTSGTTSDPKGVMLSHANIQAEAEGAFRLFTDIGEHDALLGVLPLFHALSQMASLLLPAIKGARVVFLESLNTSELMRALRERGITIFVCVPQFFYLIHNRIFKEVATRGRMVESLFRTMLSLNRITRRMGLNLGPLLFKKVHQTLGSRMRLLITGGSRLDPKIGVDFDALGFTLLNAYGLTETSGATTVTTQSNNIIGSVGKPMPGNEVRIHKPENDPETGYMVGEIAVRGGIVMKGYYNRPDATAAVMDDGWLLTGDLGRLDEHGNVFITGRAKDIIVLASGKNIYPEEIEAHYQRSPLIKEIAVIGLESQPGEPISERLHGVIVPNFEVLRERKIVNAGEAIRFELDGLSWQLPATKRILSYDIWQEDLPRTTTRKVKRNEVEKRARAMQGRSAEPSEPTGSLTAEDEGWMGIPEVQRALMVLRDASNNKRERILPNDNLELDLGLDSMERVELLVALERELNSHVPDSIVSEVYTVRELVDAVRARIGAESSRDKDVAAWGTVLQIDPTEPGVLDIARPRTLRLLFWYCFGQFLMFFCRIAFRIQVTGIDKLPRKGPYIIAPNHQTYIDAPIFMGLLPWSVFRHQFSVGTSDIFGAGLVRRIANSFNLVPVDPDANMVPAMKAAGYGLRHGKILVIFPEGERSIDGTPKKFKKGTAILAVNLNLPIYPVALDGFFEAWPRGQRFRGFTRTKFMIGDPIYPPQNAASPEAAYEQLTTELKDRVMEMWLQIHEPDPQTANATAD